MKTTVFQTIQFIVRSIFWTIVAAIIFILPAVLESLWEV